MNIKDYTDVYSLWNNTPGMGLNATDDSEAGIRKYLERNPSTCFVAVEKDNIIGIIMSGHDGRRGFIHHTAVKASERKRGIGGLLVKHAMTALESEGINKVALVVFEKNELGNSFWEKQGFTCREDLNYRNKSINDLRRIDT